MRMNGPMWREAASQVYIRMNHRSCSRISFERSLDIPRASTSGECYRSYRTGGVLGCCSTRQSSAWNTKANPGPQNCGASRVSCAIRGEVGSWNVGRTPVDNWYGFACLVKIEYGSACLPRHVISLQTVSKALRTRIKI
jgi:hypothetical protein